VMYDKVFRLLNSVRHAYIVFLNSEHPVLAMEFNYPTLVV